LISLFSESSVLVMGLVMVMVLDYLSPEDLPPRLSPYQKDTNMTI
jgi:hypothetical protein